MSELDLFHGVNAGYVAELYERYRRDPSAVDESARALFERWAPVFAPVEPAPSNGVASAAIVGAAAAADLAQSIRLYGHRAARIDPLGSEPPGDPQLEPTAHGISSLDLAALPASVVGGSVDPSARTAADAIAWLRAVYCGSTGYELAHVHSPEERDWLQAEVEQARHWPPLEPVDERRLLDRLTEISAFERFLHRAYPGATRFSIEGLGMMIPMLDEMIACAGESGTRAILLGMAHRGRLNVLAHVLGKEYERILSEFEGQVPSRRRSPTDHGDDGWQGDVKYHAGGRRSYGSVTVTMAPNPSHLELVNPVVEGMARAADEVRRGPGRPRQDEIASLAVLIHGDAAFIGQGIVAETLNLSRLPGYRTGGTLHLIANNQLGFTTEPDEARSTLYASDLARGFEIPVVHVNASDPIACLAAARLAVAYRTRFRKDFLIDLVGYRRWGHNEGDEPSFTQPRMYAAIAATPTVRQRYAADLVERGVVEADEPAALLESGLADLQRIRESVRTRTALPAEGELDPGGPPRDPAPTGTSTGLPHARLRALNEALFALPEGHRLNPRLERAIARRRAAFDAADGAIDWGHAEALAFAGIIADGTPIRLTGQDVVRGTFSQRHLAFVDPESGAAHTPLEHLAGAASFDAHNSPLSENAALGFEYGYSLQAPDALVLWEAQYGDFIDGAQAIVDEFIASGQAKWGLRSGLVLLLPHGYEGQGPDHSSARPERFLGLAAEENLRVAYPTTAGQYFHLLRRQAGSLGLAPRPLIVMTPKSLLRHPAAEARPGDLTGGEFAPVLDDPRASANPGAVRRVVFCSGKVWADVVGDRRRAEAAGLAVVRLEELYPFPEAELTELLGRYGAATELIWLQEEPRNMGGWSFAAPRLAALAGARGAPRYIGRPDMASPAEGWAEAHRREQARIVDAVYEGMTEHVG